MDLPVRHKSRLLAMNKRLYPAVLRWRKDLDKFAFHYCRRGHRVDRVLNADLEVAYEQALIMRREYEETPTITARDMSLEQWYSDWSEKHFQRLAPNTVAGYGHFWNAIPQSLKESPLTRLSADFIQSELLSIESDSVRQHSAVLLRTLINAAVKKGYIPPLSFTASYKKQKKPVVVLSPEQLESIIKAASPSARPILAIAAYCGLRKGEIMALRNKDVDLTTRLLYVYGSRTRIFSRDESQRVDELKSTKTGNPRVVPIPSTLTWYITISGQPDSLLFPVFRSDLRARLAAACKKVGAPIIGMHDLRHIFGSHIIMKAGPAAAQALLGHADINTTTGTYGHLTDSYLAGIVEGVFGEKPKLENIIEGMLSHPDEQVREWGRELKALRIVTGVFADFQEYFGIKSWNKKSAYFRIRSFSKRCSTLTNQHRITLKPKHNAIRNPYHSRPTPTKLYF